MDKLFVHVQNLLGESSISTQRISGGDINDSFHIVGEEQYFVKINKQKPHPDLFEKEKLGLSLISLSDNSIQTPTVIETGFFEDYIFLILRYLESSMPSRNDWMNLGVQLAKLHDSSAESFGLKFNNYIATINQENSRVKSWDEFYAIHRLNYMADLCRNKGQIDRITHRLVIENSMRIAALFPPEKPSLLHGDLWSGNVHCSKNGFYFIDPAPYYGHREMDIAMCTLFGGFDQLFFSTYQEISPLENSWQERQKFAQLYPLLVHSYLFGGNYVDQIKSILGRL